MSRSKDFEKALHWHLDNGFVKVGLQIEDGPMSVEWLWCEPVDDKLLKVRNTPFFTPVVCLGDVIEAEPMGAEYKDHCYRMTNVVERVREPLYFSYDIEMPRAELEKRFSVFCQACREHECYPECAVAGYVVVAVPYGEGEESLTVILQCAETAGLDMEMMTEEDER